MVGRSRHSTTVRDSADNDEHNDDQCTRGLVSKHGYRSTHNGPTSENGPRSGVKTSTESAILCTRTNYVQNCAALCTHYTRKSPYTTIDRL